MATQPLVTILPNFPLPEPTSYSGTTSTITDGGHSVSGKLLSSVVRKDIAQISLSWNYLDAAAWAGINRIFTDEHVNKIRFFNQTTGNWDERNMYVSDRSAGLWRRDQSGTVLGWTGCGLQLMEV
ncbi:MAG: hypothetical protein FWC77_04155 [Defluviitaleaceae bacterium]|nr:hypothetical protein [Defluviitaleaceae bacterium]